MRKICSSIFVAIMLGLMLPSCSMSDLRVRGLEYEYNPEWAMAYYYGEIEDEQVGRYGLMLISGRTDEDINLVSSGATMLLMLNAPLMDVAALPIGIYNVSSNGHVAYTFDYGTLLDENVVEGSYVSVRTRRGTVLYPVEGGSLTVGMDDSGRYGIKAELLADGCSFCFEYEGRMDTYDCSSPI